MFLAALAVIVILATFPALLPHYDGKPLKNEFSYSDSYADCCWLNGAYM